MNRMTFFARLSAAMTTGTHSSAATTTRVRIPLMTDTLQRSTSDTGGRSPKEETGVECVRQPNEKTAQDGCGSLHRACRVLGVPAGGPVRRRLGHAGTAVAGRSRG